VRKQVELLEDHADLAAQRAQLQLAGAELGAGHRDVAFVDVLQAVDAA